MWCADPNADPATTGDFVPYSSCQDGSSILVGYGGNSTFSCEDSISLYVDKAQAASAAGSSCDASVLLARREALSKCGPVSFDCGVASIEAGDVCKDAAENAELPATPEECPVEYAPAQNGLALFIGRSQ
ncbi:MAG: hypothetical protein ABGY24_03805, partial [bacterium]